jgi:hypothetical protein
MPWATRGSQLELRVLNPLAWLDPQTWTTGSRREFVLNVLLFVPAGLLAARYGTRRGVLAPLLLTAAIEIVQIPMGDRMSDPRDLVADTTGGALGATLATLLRGGTRTPTPFPGRRARGRPTSPPDRSVASLLRRAGRRGPPGLAVPGQGPRHGSRLADQVPPAGRLGDSSETPARSQPAESPLGEGSGSISAKVPPGTGPRPLLFPAGRGQAGGMTAPVATVADGCRHATGRTQETVVGPGASPTVQ